MRRPVLATANLSPLKWIQTADFRIFKPLLFPSGTVDFYRLPSLYIYVLQSILLFIITTCICEP